MKDKSMSDLSESEYVFAIKVFGAILRYIYAVQETHVAWLEAPTGYSGRNSPAYHLEITRLVGRKNRDPNKLTFKSSIPMSDGILTVEACITFIPGARSSDVRVFHPSNLAHCRALSCFEYEGDVRVVPSAPKPRKRKKASKAKKTPSHRRSYS